MKTIILTFVVLIGIIFNLSAKEKSDSPTHLELAINLDDIIDALKGEGIQIFKFNTGDFDKKLELNFVLEEYANDTLKQEILLSNENNYYRTYDATNQRIEKFVSQIRVITKEEDTKCMLSIDLHGSTANREFTVEKTYNRQFFVWKPYSETHWKMNVKTPLLAYISSWRDKKGYIRCCGASKLKVDDEETNKLFSYSPNYFIISYIVKEIE